MDQKETLTGLVDSRKCQAEEVPASSRKFRQRNCLAAAITVCQWPL